MKKRFGWLLLMILICTSCTSQEMRTQDKAQREYTFLIFMNGSDLESEYGAGTEDLVEMMKVGSNENINIVIETGGTERWRNRYVDPSQNQRWLVGKNHMTHLQDLGQKSMGNGDTLRDFIIWGVENYPAEKYALILWNHGGGAISGFGYDEKYNYDTLLLPELKRSLDEAYKVTNQKLEMIGFDACLMASLETASITSNYANYLVASTELEPAMGWEYSSFLGRASRGNIDGSELGKEIANGFIQATHRKGQDDLATLSVIDLNNIDDLTKSFEAFIDKANEHITEAETFIEISSCVSRAEFYGGQSPEEGYSNMIDLGNLTENLGVAYAEDRKKILQDVEDAVVYQVRGKAKEESSGISIYFPYYNKENLNYELPIYHTIGFSDTYSQFIDRYTEVALSDQSAVALSRENIQRQGKTYRLNVKDAEANSVNRSSLALGERLDEGEILLYGNDAQTKYDKKSGQLEVDFDYGWMSLDGHFMFVRPISVQDGYTVYSLPVIFNGEYANIRVLKVKGEKDYEIIGAWHGVIPESMAVRKEVMRVKDGDEITPLYKIYNSENEEMRTVEGSSFTIKGEPVIELSGLPDKEFVLGFCIDDYSLNQCFSAFLPIKPNE